MLMLRYADTYTACLFIYAAIYDIRVASDTFAFSLLARLFLFSAQQRQLLPLRFFAAPPCHMFSRFAADARCRRHAVFADAAAFDC